LLVGGHHLAGQLLGGLDIGLVKGMDVEEESGDSCGHFPVQKGRAEIVGVR